MSAQWLVFLCDSLAGEWSRASTIAGLDWWTGLVDWTGLDWNGLDSKCPKLYYSF